MGPIKIIGPLVSLAIGNDRLFRGPAVQYSGIEKGEQSRRRWGLMLLPHCSQLLDYVSASAARLASLRQPQAPHPRKENGGINQSSHSLSSLRRSGEWSFVDISCAWFSVEETHVYTVTIPIRIDQWSPATPTCCSRFVVTQVTNDKGLSMWSSRNQIQD